MFFTKTFVAFFVLATPFLVRADVTPTAPAPGAKYSEGGLCNIAWLGDKSSTTLWKNMAIELMSGNNTDMVFITTVATGQDGTKDNPNYSYPCPNVTPNSPIYFYQFTAPLATNLTWTGRFTITTPSGGTTPPENNSTDADGNIIYWGIGGLVDPSSAVAAPSFASSISMTASIASNSSTVGVVVSSTATPAITSDVANSNSIPLSTSASSSTAQPTSGAMATFDRRILGAAATVAAATLVLSFVW